VNRSHTLLVGATGMLREAAVELARHSTHVTSIARTDASLARLDGDLRDAGCVHHAVPVDHRDPDRFAAAVSGAIGACGPIDLAVGWFHSTGREAAHALGEILTAQQTDARYFRALGSAAGDPTASLEEESRTLRALGGFRYRTVVLGFVVEGAGSRWLTDAEISAGVLRAVETDAAHSVVGTVEPWSRRP